MRSLVWFRRDLRTTDNTALAAATRQNTSGTVALFVVTPDQWKKHEDADGKVHFWLSNLQSLSQSLAKINIPLIVQTCPTYAEVPGVVAQAATENQCERVFFNREYEVNERRRDESTTAACQELSIDVFPFDDRSIVAPRRIQTKDSRFYRVFTPYRRVWDTLATGEASPVSTAEVQPVIDVNPTHLSEDLAEFGLARFDRTSYRSDLWKPGEAEARRRLNSFAKKISNYQVNRDLPSVNGTSLLSPYLAAGVISPRECFGAAAVTGERGEEQGPGATTWISELAWRDFYAHVAVGFPRVSMDLPFKTETDSIPWRTDEGELTAWKTGQTGYPFVDAGMRQLNQTGWMHNRLRMVTAMFLTKHLLIDWRLGESYFMQKLIDGDLIANNGGWQWSASTGTDAVPYFRIFNPFSQSKRFDAEGKFIKKFCPELQSVPAAAFHDPQKLKRAIKDLGVSYPACIVDHSTARERALNAFKALKNDAE